MCRYDCFALPSGAWIITGGMHAGVMKHVGEAVRDYSVGASSKNKVIALAVCPWGCVQGRQGLVDPSVSISHIFDLLNKPRFVKKWLHDQVQNTVSSFTFIKSYLCQI